MTTYGHNTLNQLTAIGGSGGVKTVIVRGDTSEPASVKVKPGTSATWKDAKMLQGQRFEADVDLATGPNQINVQAKDGSDNTSNYTYALNLAAATAATPTFDADGNLLSDGTRSYEWDLQNRLVKITWGAASNKSTEFCYNALGQRSERVEKTGTTETARYYYLCDGTRLLCRYTGGTAASNIDRRYFSQGEQRKNGASWNSHYYTRDHLGSVREVMNSDGTLDARYDYDPYGKRSAQYLAATYTDGCDFGYTGHITQPSQVVGQSEIVTARYRCYIPDLGRWLSMDPLKEEEGPNLYAYVKGNTVGAIDPFGLDIVIIYDENSETAGGFGHAAMITGQESGWFFLQSFGAAEGSCGGSSGDGNELYQKAFSSKADAMAEAKRLGYDKFNEWNTDVKQDGAARKAFRKRAKNYNVTSNNCTNAVMAGLDGAGVENNQDSNIPNKHFDYNVDVGGGSGTIKPQNGL